MENPFDNFKMTVIEALAGLLVTISLGLSGFALKWQFDANADIKVMSQKIDQLSSALERRKKFLTLE